MHRGFNWVVVVAAVLIATMVGVMAYNAGVSHGLALGAAAAGAERTVTVVPYMWHGPWGFGFLGPFFFVFFWFLLLRAVWWGGFRRRWSYSGACDALPPLEEWHRRAHERMNQTPTEPQRGA